MLTQERRDALYAEGRRAYARGDDYSNCPYTGDEYWAWVDGLNLAARLRYLHAGWR